MKLTAGDVSFELIIVGYQFPEEPPDDDDSDWLIIECAVGHPRGGWRFRDPCLMTYEAVSLADWLESVAAGADIGLRCDFMEPNLAFELARSRSGRILRVLFDCEFAPWARRGASEELVFPVTDLDLVAGAESLRRQLAAYTQRAEP